jgi:protein phosphatase methylesterase 1
MSKDTMLRDVEQVVNALLGDNPPPIILIGHSMGGAFAIHLAAENILPSVIALIAIDVVEGTAVESLVHMQTFLRNRPQTFNSIEQAIEWHLRSGHIRNLESARISVPKQVAQMDTSDTHSDSDKFKVPKSLCTVQESVISEEQLGDVSTIPTSTENAKSTNVSMKEKYTWRVDLSRTECFWKDWFKDISKKFVSCSVPKMLMLAGVDRLDKELTIGQMQGKFQFHVMSNCGHLIHEDIPDKVCYTNSDIEYVIIF